MYHLKEQGIINNKSMIRQMLLLLTCSFCSICLYGQSDYVIEKKGEDYLAYYKIAEKSSWKLMKSFIDGKTSYEDMPIPSREYWQELVPQIRDTYLSEADVQKLRDTRVVITVNVLFDYLGNMKNVELTVGVKAFPIITKEQIISVYKAFWKLKVPVNGSLKSNQYYKGTLSLLNIDKKRKRIDRETLKKQRGLPSAKLRVSYFDSSLSIRISRFAVHWDADLEILIITPIG